MKKSTFKKAGVAVLSMAMLLSIGSTALIADAVIPSGTGEYAKTLTLPSSDTGYYVYQIAKAEKKDNIWQYTVNAPFTSYIDVANNKMVTTQAIIGNSALNDPQAVLDTGNEDYIVSIAAGTELKEIHSNSSQAEALAAQMARLAADSSLMQNQNIQGVVNASDAPTVLPVESGYYLVVSKGSTMKTEPILVDIQGGNAVVDSVKWSNVDIDKIITAITAKAKNANGTEGDTISTSGIYINSAASSEIQKSHYAEAFGGSTVSFKISTEFPKYNSGVGKPVSSDTNITDFVITDTPDSTLKIGGTDTISTSTITIKVTSEDGTTVYTTAEPATGETALSAANYTLATLPAVPDTPAVEDDPETPDDESVDFAKGHGVGFTLTFADSFVIANGGATVEVTYDAKLSDDPYLASDDLSNDNRVKLSYSNNYDTGIGTYNPNGDPDPSNPKETDEKKTIIVTTDFTVNKQDENGDPIPGAKFMLLKWKDGITAPASENAALTAEASNWEQIQEIDGIVDTDNNIDGMSKFEFKGLTEGWYKLVETKAPREMDDGTEKDSEYQVADPSVFQITNTGSNSTTYTKVFEFKNNLSINTADRSLTVQNYKGQNLPGTGGIGTYLFTFGGAAVILMAGAMFVLYMKKREVEE